MVVDVRLKPWSQQEEWRGQNLKGRFRARYVWIEEWGNLRYKDGPPVAISDWDAGLKLLRWLQLGTRVVVLLCGCRNEATCHRETLLARLETLGYRRGTLALAG
jgi:hypothetical protein